MSTHTWFYEPSTGPDALPSETNGKTYDFVDDFHNVFKAYPANDELELFSLQETLDFIKSENIYKGRPIPDSVVQLLTEFWDKYPDGMIDFG